MDIQDISTKAKPILSAYGINKAGLFGSYARNQQNQDSDIDILVELGSRKMTLLDFIGLKQELETSIGKKVDLVQYKNIKPSLTAYILQDEQVFYQA